MTSRYELFVIALYGIIVLTAGCAGLQSAGQGTPESNDTDDLEAT